MKPTASDPRHSPDCSRRYVSSDCRSPCRRSILTESTRAALLGNAKTLAAFRCGPGDARILAQNFRRLHQDFNETALLDLDDGEVMIAAPGRDAARVTVPPPEVIGPGEVVKEQSRRHYGVPREDVESKLKRALGYAR
jgi:hypothetical protein